MCEMGFAVATGGINVGHVFARTVRFAQGMEDGATRLGYPDIWSVFEEDGRPSRSSNAIG